MKLFLPSARATNYLLIVGFCSLGYAFYMRYLAIEQANVGLACAAGLDTWLCFARRIAIALFTYSVFGWAALAVAALNLLRPSLVLFGRRARARLLRRRALQHRAVGARLRPVGAQLCASRTRAS